MHHDVGPGEPVPKQYRTLLTDQKRRRGRLRNEPSASKSRLGPILEAYWCGNLALAAETNTIRKRTTKAIEWYRYRGDDGKPGQARAPRSAGHGVVVVVIIDIDDNDLRGPYLVIVRSRNSSLDVRRYWFGKRSTCGIQW